MTSLYCTVFGKFKASRIFDMFQIVLINFYIVLNDQTGPMKNLFC